MTLHYKQINDMTINQGIQIRKVCWTDVFKEETLRYAE